MERLVKFVIILMGSANSQVIQEGNARIHFPPSVNKEEVFYNPVQTFNRDLTCLVLQTFCNIYNKPAELFEAFAATGLRSIRYAREVKGISKILANDIDPGAVSVIKNNIYNNEVSHIVSPSLGDANAVLFENKANFDIIDVDPYSTASKFLESTILGVRNGGLICATSTDGRTLNGQQQDTSYAWYNVMVLKTEFSHEFGIRTLLTLMRSIAARYGRSIEPILSLSLDFYFRVFVRVWDSKCESKLTALQTSIVLYSPTSTSFWLQPVGKAVKKGTSLSVKPASLDLPMASDPISGEPLQIGGPLYSGPLHSKTFIEEMFNVIPSMKFLTTIPRIVALLHSCSRELPSPFYYDISAMTGIIKSSTPSREVVISALEKMGFEYSLTHCLSGMIKTTAPPEAMWDILKAWYLNEGKKIPQDDSPIKRILESPNKYEVVLEVDEDVKNRIREEKRLCKFYPNPDKNFGPKPAAKKKKNPK